MDELALAEPGGVQGAGRAPEIRLLCLQLVDRAGRGENAPGLRRADGGQAAEGRTLALQTDQLVLARHRQGGQVLQRRDAIRRHPGQKIRVEGRGLLSMGDQGGQRG